MEKPDRIIIDFPSQKIHESIVIKQGADSITHLARMLREEDAPTFYDEFRFFLFKEYIAGLEQSGLGAKGVKEMVNNTLNHLVLLEDDE